MIRDARNDNLWFLRRRSGKYGREPGTGSFGIVDPDDLQPLDLADYFRAYLAPDPEPLLKTFAAQPATATRAQHYLDHRDIQRLIQLPDPQERYRKLLPYYLRRYYYGMKNEARDGLQTCGNIAGASLRANFDAPEYKEYREDIIYFWRDIKYREAIPLLIDLLKKNDHYWATQTLETGWWNKDVDSALTKTRRQIYGEIYVAVYTLGAFHDPRAKEVLQLTRQRWAALNFENKQIVEECDRALKDW